MAAPVLQFSWVDGGLFSGVVGSAGTGLSFTSELGGVGVCTRMMGILAEVWTLGVLSRGCSGGGSTKEFLPDVRREEPNSDQTDTAWLGIIEAVEYGADFNLGGNSGHSEGDNRSLVL